MINWMGNNPMNRIVTAIIYTLMTGMIIGAGINALDCCDMKFAKICGIFAIIILPMLIFYWYTIYKTVDIKNKIDDVLKD